MGSKNCGHRSANSIVNVWDSDVYDESERFGRFRELCSQTFLPVRTEDVSNSGFHARMESRSVNSGWVGRCTTSPVEAFRTIRDIDNSSMECVYLTLVRSGELVTEQGQISRHFGKNEVSIGTSMKPAVTRLLSKIETLTVVLHTNELLSRIPNCDAFIAGLPWAGTPIGPLASCLNFIGACLFDAPQAELNAMIDSAMCMLPVAVGASHRNSRSGLDLSNSTLKNIVRFVNSNLSNPTLSARHASEEVGISERYVHKLFASRGTTFSTFVTAARLEKVAAEILTCPTSRISGIAYRWGFNDISTFNRLFKRHFGLCPTSFRVQLGQH